MKITDYTNEKGRGYLNNKMSAVDMEIWAVLPPILSVMIWTCFRASATPN
jgi:hypothetical protein